MEIVFEIEKSALSKVKDVLLKDDLVSRASVLFKDASTFGVDRSVYFVYVAGLEEACKRAKELVKDLGKEADKDMSAKVLAKIKEEEDSAASGFGAIFG
jgi:hypothetical protein